MALSLLNYESSFGLGKEDLSTLWTTNSIYLDVKNEAHLKKKDMQLTPLTYVGIDIHFVRVCLVQLVPL